MTCPECNVRPVRVRGRCGTCYERHRSRGELLALPREGYYKHTPQSCTICDEVSTLTAYGWSPADILAALNRNAEHVLRHLRQYAHPHADLFVPLASDSAREREHRRKATA